LKVAFDDNAVTVLESLKSRRRFEFSSSPMILRSQFAVIRQLQSDPGIVEQSILVESSAADTFLEELAANPDASETSAEIQLLEERPNHLRLNVNASRNGVFVVKDSYFPGWEATVDGAKAPILRVNGMVRGVEIASPGTHIVEFCYRPLSFWYGAFVGVGALALFLVLLFWRAADPRVIEARLIPFALICVLFVATAPTIVTPAENTTLWLGRHEKSVAIDLRNVALKWRETDSRDGRELFTRAVRFARLPVAVLGERDIPLHIGDLVYVPNTGVAEIDDRGGFREVAAVEGTVVPLCRLSETTDKKDDAAALYQQGHWQIIPQAESASSPRCTSGEDLGR
jgi:Bacterial membrane protein YfhO